MKKYISFAAFGAALVLATGCSQDIENNIVNEESTPINFTIGGEGVITRTSTVENASGYKTSFLAGDQIGIYATGITAAASNVLYAVNSDGSSLNSTTPINLKKNETAQVYAYAPYVEGQTAEKVSFEVKDDQSTLANFNASNFLTTSVADVTANNASISLSFKPRMALIRVEMQGELGKTATKVTANAIRSLIWKYVIDPANSDIEVSGTATDVIMYNQTVATETNNPVFTAFVPAQTIPSGSKFLRMTVVTDKETQTTATYAFKPSSAFALKGGSINKFVININADGSVDIVASNINVEGWGSEEIPVDSNDVTKEEEETPGGTPDPTPEGPTGETTNFINLPSAAFTEVTGLGSVKSSVPWAYYKKTTEETVKDVSYADGKFSVTSIAGIHWAKGIMHYSDKIFDGGRYTLSYTIKSDVEDATNGKVQVTISAADGSTNFYPIIVTSADTEKKYMTTTATATTTEKDVTIIFDTSKYYTSNSASTGDKSDLPWSDATETQWNAGFKLTLGFGGSTTTPITYTITNLKITKNK